MYVYRVEKDARFEASHVLPNHDGQCARMHGHSWTVTATIKGTRLHVVGPQSGMLADLGHLGLALKFITEKLDHQHLNDILDMENPTSEQVAIQRATCWSFRRCVATARSRVWWRSSSVPTHRRPRNADICVSWIRCASWRESGSRHRSYGSSATATRSGLRRTNSHVWFTRA